MDHPCCLILEDSPVVGMDLESCLADNGFSVAGPLFSCVDALTWLEASTPDLAILDYALRDGDAEEVIQTLQNRGVPVIVLSGYRPEDKVSWSPRGLVWLQKPCGSEDIIKAISALAPSTQIADPVR